MTPGQKWDRYAIKAEVERRGLTLTSISLDAGLSESAVRQALGGKGLAGMQALSAVLGVPVEELFPHRFRSDHLARKNRIRLEASRASQKRARSTDVARAS